MKKLAVISIALVLALSLAGCRNMNTGADRTGDNMDPSRGDVTSPGNGADSTGVIGTGPRDPYDGDRTDTDTKDTDRTDRDNEPDSGTTPDTQTTTGDRTDAENRTGTEEQSTSGNRTGTQDAAGNDAGGMR